MIHRARATDLDALLPLVGDFYAVDGHAYDEDIVRRALGPLLANDEFGLVWLIGADPPAGYAVVTWSYALESGGRDALLDELYVRDRSAGAGGEALEEILADCRARGITRMFLETEVANAPGRRFYSRHGFAVEGSVWMSRDL